MGWVTFHASVGWGVGYQNPPQNRELEPDFIDPSLLGRSPRVLYIGSSVIY